MPLLIRAVAKKARNEGLPVLSLGSDFKQRLYCWPLPLLHPSCAALPRLISMFLQTLPRFLCLALHMPHHCWQSLVYAWPWSLLVTPPTCFIIRLHSCLLSPCRAASSCCSLTAAWTGRFITCLNFKTHKSISHSWFLDSSSIFPTGNHLRPLFMSTLLMYSQYTRNWRCLLQEGKKI